MFWLMMVYLSAHSVCIPPPSVTLRNYTIKIYNTLIRDENKKKNFGDVLIGYSFHMKEYCFFFLNQELNIGNDF